MHSTLSEAQTNEIVSLKAEVETLTGRLVEASGQGLNLRLERHDLIRLRLAERRVHVQLADQPCDFRFLRGQRPVGFLRRAGQRMALILRRIQCLGSLVEACCERLTFGLQTENFVRLRLAQRRVLVMIRPLAPAR